jgi:hypothetical protein
MHIQNNPNELTAFCFDLCENILGMKLNKAAKTTTISMIILNLLK